VGLLNPNPLTLPDRVPSRPMTPMPRMLPRGIGLRMQCIHPPMRCLWPRPLLARVW